MKTTFEKFVNEEFTLDDIKNVFRKQIPFETFVYDDIDHNFNFDNLRTSKKPLRMFRAKSYSQNFLSFKYYGKGYSLYSEPDILILQDDRVEYNPDFVRKIYLLLKKKYEEQIRRKKEDSWETEHKKEDGWCRNQGYYGSE